LRHSVVLQTRKMRMSAGCVNFYASASDKYQRTGGSKHYTVHFQYVCPWVGPIASRA